MIICTVLFTSGLLLLFGFSGNLGIIAALGVAGVVCCAAATAGDVSQDLKTGWLVKATPAKQQYAQVIGVAASAFLIAPVLGMLHNAYTIGSSDLPAPQAGMFASIVDKIFRHKPFPWEMAVAGACVAVALIVIDEILRKKGSAFRTYVMPVAVGIYLPITLAVPILIGGLINLIVGRVSGKGAGTATAAVQRGVLFCAGLIAGEAVMGIIIGGLKVTANLPIGIWGAGAKVLPSLISILALAAVIVLVFVVSLKGKEAKQS
jgi:putative OPT family oligopeptide transporter